MAGECKVGANVWLEGWLNGENKTGGVGGEVSFSNEVTKNGCQVLNQCKSSRRWLDARGRRIREGRAGGRLWDRATMLTQPQRGWTRSTVVWDEF